MDDYKALLKEMVPGTSWHINYGEGNPNNQLIHILAIVDGEYIVYKTWFKHKQRWHRAVQWVYYYWLAHKSGALTKRK